MIKRRQSDLMPNGLWRNQGKGKLNTMDASEFIPGVVWLGLKEKMKRGER